MRQVCASFGVPAVLMHMPATPEEMGWSQSSGVFTDIVAEVSKALSQLAVQALADGVPSVILDPGFGFGKSILQNFELIRGLDEIRSLGHAVMLGASRKSSLSRIAGAGSPEALVPASLAAHLYGFQRGADILRVHDVEAHIQAIRIWKYLEQKDS